MSDGHGRRCIQHVMPPRNMQFKGTERAALRKHPEAGEAARLRLQELKAIVRFGSDAIGEDAAMHPRKHRSKLRVIEARGDRSIERHLIHEREKGLLDIGHVAVAIHMLAIEIGHDGENRRQLEKRAIALVGLGHQELARAKLRIRTQCIDAAADNHRRIETACSQHRGHHRCRRRLAMHSGNGDAVFEAHQLGQHLGALNDLNLALARLQDFRIRSRHRRAGHNHRCVNYILRIVAFVDCRAKLGESIGHRTAAQIGTGDLDTEAQQNLGDAAHADAAYPDEVRVLRRRKH